jgi:hypothetical protein
MRKLASSLVSDFQANLNDTDFCSTYQAMIRLGKIVDVRGLESAAKESMTVAEFKAAYQIDSLLKRYRFSKDLFRDQELIDKALRLIEKLKIGLPRLILTRCQQIVSLS